MSGTRTSPLRLGLALDFGTDAAAGSVAEQVRQAVPLLREAEQAGLDSVWVGESFHRSPEPFHLPAALMVLAHLAPHCSMGLGTGVMLVRAQDTDRLATEAALLDQLSGGRLTLGLGLGQDVLRGALGGPDRPGGAMFDDLLRGLRDRWGAGAPGAFEPAPHRHGGPPVLVGGANDAAVRRAAALGDGYYAATNYSDRLLGDRCAAYLDRVEVSRAPRIAVNRLCVVHPDGAVAQDRAAAHTQRVLTYYRSRSAWDVGRGADDPEPVLIGSAGEVVERLRWYRDLGVTQVQVRVAPTGASSAVARETVAQLAEHVIPVLEQEAPAAIVVR